MSDNRRVWLVTGTSTGLGRALIEELLIVNERVVATLRKPEAIASLKKQYPETQLLVLPLDVTNSAQIAAAFEATEKHFGRLDVVVNNAGYAVCGEIEGTPDEDARAEFEVQFWGPVNITKQAIKFFREVNPVGHGGRIFNISTIGGYSGKQSLAFYSSSKFALEGFTESFIKEMPPAWNIKGCIIEPGGVETEWRNASMNILPQHPAYTDPNTPTSLFRSMHQSVPMIGNTERMARAIISLGNEQDLPLRVQLGSEAVALIISKAKATIHDSERWMKFSQSTDKDGIDIDAYMHQIGLAAT